MRLLPAVMSVLLLSGEVRGQAVPSITPAALIFTRQTSPIRYVDAWSSRFNIQPQDNFSGSSPGTLYNTMVSTGTSSVAYGGGACVFSGASSGETVYATKALSVAPYCWGELSVTAITGTGQPELGFGVDSNNYMRITYNGTQFASNGKLAGSAINAGAVSYTAKYPFVMRAVLCWPEWHVYVSDSDGDRWLGKSTVTQDLRPFTAGFLNWGATFGAIRAAGDSVSCGYFRCGYNGGIGIRDFHQITYTNGMPYTNGTKIYFTATCATGSDYETNNGAVLSVDVGNSYALKIESLMFYNVANSDRTNPSGTKDTRTSLYAGIIKRDPVANKWIITPNGWGLGNVSTGIQVWYAESTADLANAGGGNPVAVIDSYQLNLPTSTSLYDNDQYFDGTNWNMVVTETNLASGWTNWHARLFSGATLQSMTAGATDLSHSIEGCSWARIGGAWYVTAACTVGGPVYWNSGLTYLGSLSANVDVSGTSATFGIGGSHFAVCPINNSNGTTTYLTLLFDNSEISTFPATKGAGFVDTSQSVSGWEWNNPLPGPLKTNSLSFSF